jgi:hypothetical protein
MLVAELFFKMVNDFLGFSSSQFIFKENGLISILNFQWVAKINRSILEVAISNPGLSWAY